MATRLGDIDCGRMYGDPWLLRLGGNTQVMIDFVRCADGSVDLRRVPRVVMVLGFSPHFRHFSDSVHLDVESQWR